MTTNHRNKNRGVCLKVIQRLVLTCALLVPTLSGTATAAPAATFGIEIGNALLCLNQLNSKYFYDYLFEALGKPYKVDGGAYWFKAKDVTLWGLEITDVLVNDSTSPADFVGAVMKDKPQALAEAISKSVNIRFTPEDNSKYALLKSQAGSTIAYEKTKSKIYCAKSKYLVPGKQ